MANWCRYCKGSYPKYWCESTNEYVSWGVVQRYCMNNGYKCSNYHISTSIGSILNKGKDDKVLNNIKKLRDEYLEKNEEYSSVLKMYDVVGPRIALAMENDENKEALAEKIYNGILTPISKMCEEERYESALDKYSAVTEILIRKYGVKSLFEDMKEYTGFDDSLVSIKKKGKKLAKTLD